MSKLNGDKSRFQINRKRKMRRRERLQVTLAAITKRAGETAAASIRMHDEGGPVRNGE
jgi:hypothetical protein